MSELTHLNHKGEAHMVNVGEKESTQREAVAEAFVVMNRETLKKITEGNMPKGDVFATARIAGIMAAKRCWELIPLCHQIPIEGIELNIESCPPDRILIKAAVKCDYKTGIEMEALTAASVAALTIYDMCKAIDRGMTIERIRLLQKSGGRSGTYIAEENINDR